MKLLGTPKNFPDMPKLWDGEPVTWEAWEKRIANSIDYHLDASGACDGCGLRSSLWQSTGICGRSHMGGGWARKGMRNFYAERCGWCGHTTVHTMHDNKSWTLDESDYGVHGSYDNDEIQRLF